MSCTAQDQIYDRLVNELAYKYSGVFSRESIRAAVAAPSGELGV